MHNQHTYINVTDTSEIYLSLKKQYNASKKPLRVNFREIVNWVKSGDQFTHQIHPYPAKLLPHIAYFFSNARVLVGNEQSVLDPFCGSGTVALEASLAGLTPYICDSNPLALLIAKVKTMPYDTSELLETLDIIKAKVAKFRTAPKVDVINHEKWYFQKTKFGLEKIYRAIIEIENSIVKEFFEICFSLTAKRCSRADPSIAVPVLLKPKKKFSENKNNEIISHLLNIENTSPLGEFYRICINNINRIKKTNEIKPQRKAAKVVSNNVFKLSSNTETFKTSLIITSPPYGCAQKYIRSSSLSLNWLELASPPNLKELDSISIGRESSPANTRVNFSDKLPIEFELLLQKIKEKNLLRYYITNQYLYEMKNAYKQLVNCIENYGYIVIVTGNNLITENELRNDQFTIQIMRQLGLKLELHLIDSIKSRGLMTKRNVNGSIIKDEHILVFKKESK
ncbi:DNA adenine methylase [Thorsellia anophelis]|uniref:D12 class N6 adenine-specific DNA methyltransferase n=1 Tax=Thorsellia anophelis DSM 18579 TaxID=1123402 RepID=A0A1I0FVL5_9GAMM|nr:DNA adenine methylase [Thorsellia anophelis]SET62521.1 D12 class N6 adenine-specific DNA methyltransferase [Thorsellia anophelis DSM 18579]